MHDYILTDMISGRQNLDKEADSTVSPMEGKLTVYFEDPFWVGVFERVEEGKLSVCKVTFGAEPKDYFIFGLCQAAAGFAACKLLKKEERDNRFRSVKGSISC